jgi:Dyp-type peroxidase family
MGREHLDIQGNILRGYRRHDHAAYVFARISDRRGAAKLLRDELISMITTDEDFYDRRDPPTTLNIAFTYEGLRELAPMRAPAVFAGYEDFRDGMRQRAVEKLGDEGGNHPDHWEARLVEPEAHMLFTLYARTGDQLADHVAWLHATLARAGAITDYHFQYAQTLAGKREHFGFLDGFSQPALRGDRPPFNGEGVLDRCASWRGLHVGEFLLGHFDEDGWKPGYRQPLLKNGTFMVWRKLRQHVDVFEQWLTAEAGPDAAAQERLKAQLVGRWPRSGESLITAPYFDPGAKGSEPDNEFVYSADPRGTRCPLGAHVRRANPRDGLGYRTQRTKRNRIIRRGMPYSDLDGTKGLIFVCFQASISRQFELIQGHWLQDGDAFGLGGDRDFITAATPAAARMTLPGDKIRPPRFLTRDTQFVTTRGGYYLFVPGIRALRRLVRC